MQLVLKDRSITRKVRTDGVVYSVSQKDMDQEATHIIVSLKVHTLQFHIKKIENARVVAPVK
tara:strand:- start:277 stop:462 length:186 start_codon:yes stop_codon:yes gene_type:complete